VFGDAIDPIVRLAFPALPLASLAVPGAAIPCAHAGPVAPNTEIPSNIHFFMKLPAINPSTIAEPFYRRPFFALPVPSQIPRTVLQLAYLACTT
jgi:hypothetical protein